MAARTSEGKRCHSSNEGVLGRFLQWMYKEIIYPQDRINTQAIYRFLSEVYVSVLLSNCKQSTISLTVTLGWHDSR